MKNLMAVFIFIFGMGFISLSHAATIANECKSGWNDGNCTQKCVEVTGSPNSICGGVDFMGIVNQGGQQYAQCGVRCACKPCSAGQFLATGVNSSPACVCRTCPTCSQGCVEKGQSVFLPAGCPGSCPPCP